MKEMKRIISLNLALALFALCFLGTVSATTPQEPEHQFEKYIIVDGVEYDATQSPSGEGWTLSYDTESKGQNLFLEDYTGGSIYTNIDLVLYCEGENNIIGDKGWGIYVDGWLILYTTSGILRIGGADGYEAVFVSEYIHAKGPFTATGGNISALSADIIDFDLSWPNTILVGDSAESAIEGVYTNQQYINFILIPYTLTLEANGGRTFDGNTNYVERFITGEAGHNSLIRFSYRFVNGGKTLLGWTDNEDGTGNYYAIEDEYVFAPETFEATLYAFWEDEENKAVKLKDYGDPTDGYYTWDRVVACKVGSIYVLPESHKPGCTFDGWITEKGEFLAAGTEIIITDNTLFTARYTPLTFIVDGQEYDASEDQCGLGWYYYSGSTETYLNIDNEYAGGYIEMPCDTRINIWKSLSGADNMPAIFVDGDILLNVSKEWDGTHDSIQLKGGFNAPAVVASGNIYMMAPTKGDSVSICGGENAPALSAGGTIQIGVKVYYAGSDEDHLEMVGKYSGEHYLNILDTWIYSIELSGTTMVPTVPDNDAFVFLCWEADQTGVYYKPGEMIHAGTFTKLTAKYMENNRSSVAMFLDGNGGKTFSGSNYYVKTVSTHDLSLYRLPDSELSYPGHTLTGYNTAADGTGTSYPKGGTIPDDNESLIYYMYAQWQPISGSGGSGGSGGSTDINKQVDSAIKEAEKNADVTLWADGGGNRVALSKENVEEILEKNLGVEARTEAGFVSLSSETFRQIAEKYGGKEMEFVLKKEKGDNSISVGGTLVHISVLIDGKEVHDIDGTAKVSLDTVSAGNVVTVVHHREDGTVGEVFFSTVKELGWVEFPFSGLSYYSFLTRGETPASLVFDDVVSGEWFEAAVDYAYQNELFSGTSGNTFSPEMDMSREMFATVLYNLAGSPAAEGESKFSDVKDSGAYYYLPILWAAKNDIISGYPDHSFGVGDAITREQMVMMLYKYAREYNGEDVSVGAGTELAGFTDAKDISQAMYEAFCWSVGEGIVGGTRAQTLSPQTYATRAEVSQILMNYCVKKQM